MWLRMKDTDAELRLTMQTRLSPDRAGFGQPIHMAVSGGFIAAKTLLTAAGHTSPAALGASIYKCNGGSYVSSSRPFEPPPDFLDTR
jgi:hypothetical protein